MHEFSEEQKQAIAAWIESGQTIADVQKRVREEFEVSLTYMETRFLVDDLRLLPKDPEEPEPKKPEDEAQEADLLGDEAPAGGVQVTMDQITKPGTLVSGKVRFSDGGKADWYLDQMGRLGLTAAKEGYRPSEPDLIEFQQQLQKLVAGPGY